MNKISLALRRLLRLAVVVEDPNGGATTITNKCAVVITNGMVMDSSLGYNKNSSGKGSSGSSSAEHLQSANNLKQAIESKSSTSKSNNELEAKSATHWEMNCKLQTQVSRM